MAKKGNLIEELSFQFALDAIGLYKILAANKEFIISKQLLRSSTSIGANIEEAQAAQSRRDFLSKISIAAKEARETHYWLRLLNESKIMNIDVRSYISKIISIGKVLTNIIKTTSKT